MVMKSLGQAVSAFPKVTIAILIVVTIIAVGFIGIFGIDQEFSESSFMPENEVVIAQEEVADLFSTSNVYRVSILVKDKDRDVLTSWHNPLYPHRGAMKQASMQRSLLSRP